MPDPNRANVYDGATKNSEKARWLLRSARGVVEYLANYHTPRSVVDFGCKQGEWLDAFRQAGAERLLGLDAPRVEALEKLCPTMEFRPVDFERPIAVNERFDLSVCLEVVERIDDASGVRLIEELTSASDVVLFSAAIPHQPGEQNINCRYPSYWCEYFQRAGYEAYDLFRKHFWMDRNVPIHYQQGLLLYVNASSASTAALRERLAGYRVADPRKMDLVHPELYEIQAVKFRRTRAQQKLTQRFEAMSQRAKRIAEFDVSPYRLDQTPIDGDVKAAVVSANFGAYDEVKPIAPLLEAIPEPVESFYFTDSETGAEAARSAGWRHVYRLTRGLARLDDRLRAKFFKIKAHCVSDVAAFAKIIWVDAALQFDNPAGLSAFFECVSRDLQDSIVLVEHSRKTLGAEFSFIEDNVSGSRYLRQVLESEPIVEQRKAFENNDINFDAPLYVGSMFARGRGIRIDAMCDFWWEMNLTHSARDQLSLPVALDVFGIDPLTFRFAGAVSRIPHLRPVGGVTDFEGRTSASRAG